MDLSGPLNLPDVYTPYYKHIKDTLWSHSTYRFVLDHLSECVVIDLEHDIDDYSGDIGLTQQLAHTPASYSVVDTIISMNPGANASCTSDIQHIQHSSRRMTTPPLSSDTTSFTIVDHVPDEALNQKFVQQLHSHNLRVTKVSGDGLNCLIHAMIQHAKQEYQRHHFEEADMIRKCLQQKYPEMTGMLHVDDHYAEDILALVNDHCCAAASKLKMVSVVIASSDGPIIYGGTCDKRYSAGQHVVLWQQGSHYASIVHHSDLVQAISQCQATDHDTPKINNKVVPKLTKRQQDALLELVIIKKNQKGNYEVCAGRDQIELTLQSKESRILSDQDKDQVRKFLYLKLEIDYETLNGSPRQLLSDQHQILYDDLCQYAVIKPVKIKEKMQCIEEVCYKRFGYKGCVSMLDVRPHFDLKFLNVYLQRKGIEMSKQEQEDLVDFLTRNSILSLVIPGEMGAILDERRVLAQYIEKFTSDHSSLHLLCDAYENIKKFSLDHSRLLRLVHSGLQCSAHYVDIKEFTSDHSLLLRSATFINENQQGCVEDYLRVIIHLNKNVDTIISTLRNHQSTILELETPEITLRKLSDMLSDSVQEKGDVLEWFSDNQCDLILSLIWVSKNDHGKQFQQA